MIILFIYRNYVEEKFGIKYVEGRFVEFVKFYEEFGLVIFMFFILFFGVDLLKDVEVLGRILGFNEDKGNFYNIFLG